LDGKDEIPEATGEWVEDEEGAHGGEVPTEVAILEV